jgi:hypothetical protein
MEKKIEMTNLVFVDALFEKMRYLRGIRSTQMEQLKETVYLNNTNRRGINFGLKSVLFFFLQI